jgi:hypothetical protein
MFATPDKKMRKSIKKFFNKKVIRKYVLYHVQLILWKFVFFFLETDKYTLYFWFTIVPL